MGKRTKSGPFDFPAKVDDAKARTRAIAQIRGGRGVGGLPEGMSQERLDWLSQWLTAPEDIVRTPGTESNVKEIYDECAALARDPANEIVNQFSEFGNYLAHWRCTGPA